MLESIFEYHYRVIKNLPKYKRYLYSKINWKSKGICVTGARGTGKTTLLLQYMIEKYKSAEECLYISADNIEIIDIGLLELAKEYFKYGGKALIIDEIHKYKNWQQEIKNILDIYKDKQILISGSSSIKLQKSKYDLSRRLTYYQLEGLSFREYLILENKLNLKPFKLEDILKNHLQISQEITQKITVLKEFKKYLKYGYYPFYLDNSQDYHLRLSNVIEKVLFEDVAFSYNIKISSVNYLKKILYLLATSNPFILNISKLSRDLGISKEYVYIFIEYLTLSKLINSISSDVKGYVLIRKPQKIYLDNTNILYTIDSTSFNNNIGTIREIFFANQLLCNNKLNSSKSGDFIIDNKYTIEVGGQNKTFEQIKNIKNSYLAIDNIETGIGTKIPLYLFGLLY